MHDLECAVWQFQRDGCFCALVQITTGHNHMPPYVSTEIFLRQYDLPRDIPKQTRVGGVIHLTCVLKDVCIV